MDIIDDNTLELELIKSIPTGMGIFDVTGNVVKRLCNNDGYYQMIGTVRDKRSRFFGENSIYAIHPDDRTGIIEEAKASIRENRIFNMRFRILSGSGEYEWISIRANHKPINNETERFYAAYYNIDDLIEHENNLKSVIESENFIVELLRNFNKPENFDRNISAVLKKLGEYLSADRAYVFVLAENDTVLNNSFEWCKKDVLPQKDFLQNVDAHYIDRWMPYFEKGQSVVIRNIETIRESNPSEYSIMTLQNIRSYLEAPLYADEKFIGFIGVDNPEENMISNVEERFLSLAYFVSAAMARSNANALLKQSEENERNQKRIYEASVENVELFVCEFNVADKAITLMDNPYTLNKSKEYGIPRVINNVPDCFINNMNSPNYKTVTDMFEKLYNGIPRASCTIWFKPDKNENPIWLKLNYTTVFNSEKQPCKSYFTSQNITRQSAEIDKYRQELAYYESADSKNLIAKGHHNLSDNCIINYTALSEKALDINPFRSYDDNYMLFYLSSTNEQDRCKVKNFVSRDNLIKQFTEGKSNFICDFTREIKGKNTTWVRTEIHIFEAPESHKIESFIYTYDITEEHLAQMMVQRMAALGYDTISIINTESGSFTAYEDANSNNFSLKKSSTSYKNDVIPFLAENVSANQKQEVIKAVGIETIKANLEKSDCYTFAYDSLAADGTSYRKFLQYCCIDDDKRNILFCISDITKQYLNEQRHIHQLQDVLLEAEKANSAKTEFISRISHDIRTPIGAITNMTAFAFEDIDDKEKLKDDLRKIQVSNTFLLSLINDVLDISKIDSGKIELNPEPYLYDDFISNIRNMFEPLCNEKNIKLEIESEKISSIIKIDKTRFNQIAMNLISNAVKFTPDGGTIRIYTFSQSRGNGLCDCIFRVSDSGIGMSSEFVSNMFEPFSQEYENPLRDKTITGTGLGLSIVKKIVDIMGGRISVSSTPGKGTEISIYFVVENAENNKSNYSESANDKIFQNNSTLSGKVILAEDNVINTEIAKRILKALGLDVVHAENGMAALKIFEASKENEFFTILMDIQMPIMNGYEATEKIRALKRTDAKTIPIIAMTADAFSAAIEHSRAVGMTNYITKPLDIAKLKLCLEKEADKLHTE